MHAASCQIYSQKLNGLTIFRNLLKEPLIQHLQSLLKACGDKDPDAIIPAYGAFASALFERDTDLPRALLELVLEDENYFLVSAAKGTPCPAPVSLAVQKELEFFTELAAFSPKNAKAALSEEMAVFLPDWENSPLDFYTSYAERISHAAEKGYGIFARLIWCGKTRPRSTNAGGIRRFEF